MITQKLDSNLSSIDDFKHLLVQSRKEIEAGA